MRQAASSVLVVQCRGLLWISNPSVTIDKKIVQNRRLIAKSVVRCSKRSH